MRTRAVGIILMAILIGLLTQPQVLAKKGGGGKPTPPAEEPTDPPPEEPTQDPAPTVRAKVEIVKKGLYTVSASDIGSCLGIAASSVSSYISAGNVRMKNLGDEVAWLAGDGDDAIYFYGDSFDSVFCSTNVYWIEVGVAGTTMARLGGKRVRSSAEGGIFMDTLHFEEDNLALASSFYDADSDFWAWYWILPQYEEYKSWSHTFEVKSVAGSTDSAQIRMYLKGGVDVVSAEENIVDLYINDTFVAQATWDGVEEYILSSSFPQNLLVEGNNVVRLDSLSQDGVSYSWVTIDSFEISYWRNYDAVDDSLLVRGYDNPTVTVDGFSGSDLQVFDLENPNQPAQVSATLTESSAPGHKISFKPADAGRDYLVASLAAAMTPSSLKGVVPSTLSDAGNAANYVIIAPSLLTDAAAELALHRESQGLQAMVVAVEDIYDEFGYGFRDAIAIQVFLSHAYSQWAVPPAYVVLAGQGSYDFKNNLGHGDCLIPPMMVSTPFGLVESDVAFADADGNGVQDMAIGRLPICNAVELQAVIGKIKQYELGGTWKDRALMVADNPDSAGDFAALSDIIAGQASVALNVEKAYLGQQSFDDVKAAVVSGFNDGCGILNYVGHGHASKLADEGLFTDLDAAGLANSASTPIVFSMSCYVGEFGAPGRDSLAETLVANQNGGAVAVWGAVDFAYSFESQILNDAAFEAMFVSSVERLGDAIMAAARRYETDGGLPFMQYIYNLQGDPATLTPSGSQAF